MMTTASRRSAEPRRGGVKLDYSGTYRDNDSLDDTLSSQIESLQKLHLQVHKEKNFEIEAIKQDAAKIQSLKDVINQRDNQKEISMIFSKPRDSEDENGVKSSNTSRVNFRLRKELEKFSARNHFNVVLPKFNPFADISDRKPFSSITTHLSKTSVSTVTEDHKQKTRHRNYMQLTSSSRHRLARPRSVPVLADSTRPYLSETTRAQSATRSRRELEELSRIELSLMEPKTFTPLEHRQNILTGLRDQQKDLQKRVSVFVFELEKFNKQTKKDSYSRFIDT